MLCIGSAFPFLSSSTTGVLCNVFSCTIRTYKQIPHLGCVPHVSSAPNLQMLRARTDSESSNDEGRGDDSHKVDKVYTVGCFDLLHRGHENLFKNMRTMGREVWFVCIVQVHTVNVGFFVSFCSACVLCESAPYSNYV